MPKYKKIDEVCMELVVIKKEEFNSIYEAMTTSFASYEIRTFEDAYKLLELIGAKPNDSVTIDTDYLVVGSEPGTKKIANAIQYNVKIIYENEFVELLRG